MCFPEGVPVKGDALGGAIPPSRHFPDRCRKRKLSEVVYLVYNVKVLRVGAKTLGVVAIMVNMGAIGVAAFIAFMLGSSVAEALVAIWQSLSLGKFMLNAIAVVFCFFSFSSLAVREHFMFFLVPALGFALWDAMSFPHLLAYFYFAFWLVYAGFVLVNRLTLPCTADNKEDAASCRAPAGEKQQARA